MPNPLQRSGWALGTLAVGFLLGVPGAAAQKTQQSLAGTWKLNAEKTEAERPDRSADPSVRQGYSRGGRPRVGTGVTDVSGGSGASGRMGGDAARGNLGPLGLYVRPLPELFIVQTDSSITISDPRGTPRAYYLDGRKESEPLPGTDALEIVAKWKDGKLTTERKLGSFGSVRQVYSIDARSRVLVVDVKLSGPQLTQPMEMRWIYDPAPGS